MHTYTSKYQKPDATAKPAVVWLMLACTMAMSCREDRNREAPTRLEAADIKAYCIDFNWGPGGPNAFAAPGLWADANPEKHVQWYKDLGANVIQTFAVSCNGFAWYKSGVVPEQPGLKHDFLPEMVRLGHREGMKVMAYFCVAANTRWGQTHPEQSYGIPADGHIPLTLEYLEYLGRAIQDVLVKTDVDGFMIDWLFHGPIHPGKSLLWLPCEQKMWGELMGSAFPGKENIQPQQEMEFTRRSVERCWDHIRNAAKTVRPDCIIWLSCYDLKHPQVAGSRVFREVDWLMNEAGDMASIREVKDMIGPDTKLINCLANWNKADPKEVVPASREMGVGLYGFTKPTQNSLLPSIEQYLARPIDGFEGDEKNISTLVRAFHGLPLDYVNNQK
jgi:hypothetical protein